MACSNGVLSTYVCISVLTDHAVVVETGRAGEEQHKEQEEASTSKDRAGDDALSDSRHTSDIGAQDKKVSLVLF